MRLGSLQKAKAEIPTCSMADIAFLLIIFFMVTTVFRMEIGLPLLELPRAEKAEKLPRKNIAHIWIGAEENILIDDRPVAIDAVAGDMSRKYAVNPSIIVSVLTDQRASYGIMADIFDQLKDAGVLKVSLAAKRKRGG
jgi:biopolymer transport protein ExbD